MAFYRCGSGGGTTGQYYLKVTLTATGNNYGSATATLYIRDSDGSTIVSKSVNTSVDCGYEGRSNSSNTGYITFNL